MGKIFLPVLLVFIVINAITFALMPSLKSAGFDISLLLIGNLLLFLLTAGGFFFQMRGLRSPNPNAFVRSIYASLLLKIFVILITVLLYAFINREHINKQSLFTCMGLYFVYTAIEVKQLIKIARNKTDG
ncbi:MAG: hypothetical protein ABI683_06345 [Ginsengibacter sp.]